MIHANFGKGKCLNGNKPNDNVTTPVEISCMIINKFSLYGIILDPFKGTGSFYDNYPNNLEKDWCEIKQNKDFFFTIIM